MSVLEEVKAAEEKSVADKEAAKAKGNEIIKNAEAEGAKEAEKIISAAREKAAKIISEAAEVAKIQKTSADIEVRDTKEKLKKDAEANRSGAVKFVYSLINN